MGPPSTEELVKSYLLAKRTVVEHGYADEIAWQANACRQPITQQRFLREAAWVVLCSGMRESVVRRLFPSLELVFRGFLPQQIPMHRAEIREAALAEFRNVRKIDAILDIAELVQSSTSSDLAKWMHEPEEFLRSLPYIGPITWRHLAKNLGVPVPKADRHLVRLAKAAGRDSVDGLCYEISEWMGEPVAVVDLVLWRWSVVRGSSCTSTCHLAPDGLVMNPA